MLCAAAVAVLALAEAEDAALAVGVRVAAIALLALVAAVVLGWSPLVPTSLLLLGSAYATHLVLDDTPLDTRAPVLAAGLFLTAELAYWSVEERTRVRGESGESLRHFGLVVLLALAGLVVGAAVLAASDLARAQGLAVDLLGAGAAAGTLIALLLFARRPA